MTFWVWAEADSTYSVTNSVVARIVCSVVRVERNIAHFAVMKHLCGIPRGALLRASCTSLYSNEKSTCVVCVCVVCVWCVCGVCVWCVCGVCVWCVCGVCVVCVCGVCVVCVL